MTKLVTRFYDPTSGRVLIDGFDLRSDLHSLPASSAWSPRAVPLRRTSGTTISFARQTPPPRRFEEAVVAVGLTEVIERLGDGLDTVVHERASHCPRGAPLIALHAPSSPTPLLVLDEATSTSTPVRDQDRAALDVLLENRTAVLIAHGFDGMRADRIVVVDEGRIVEIGSHAELVAAGGRYAEMYARGSASGLGGPPGHHPLTPLRRRGPLGVLGDASTHCPEPEGRSWPMPGITSSSAPGIAAAVAWPPLSVTSGRCRRGSRRSGARRAEGLSAVRRRQDGRQLAAMPAGL